MTVAGRLRAQVRDGIIGPLPPEYCFVSVTGRHGQGRPPFVGVLKGLGIRTGAHGTTVAHDSHNLVIAGASPSDMLLVAQHAGRAGRRVLPGERRRRCWRRSRCRWPA